MANATTRLTPAELSAVRRFTRLLRHIETIEGHEVIAYAKTAAQLPEEYRVVRRLFKTRRITDLPAGSRSEGAAA